MGVIYKITSPTNKLYIGKTYDLRKRINCHKHASRKGSNIILHNSIRKHGWNNHILEVIEEVSEELLNEREIFWIKELNTYCYENPEGMNMTLGGDGQRSTWMHDIERRKRLSERFKGANAPFYGRRHTEENKKIIGDKARIRNKASGKVVPEWGAEKGREIVRKPVIVYNSNGVFLKEFPSIIESAKFTKQVHTSISEICNGKRTHAGGFVFRYKTNNYQLKIDVNIKEQTKARPIICFIGSYMIEYAMAQSASDDLKIPKGTINRAAAYGNPRPIRTGHVFIYKDLYEKLKLVK